MQLFQNVCVRYLSIRFMKPLDLLHLEKKITGSSGPSYPKAVLLYFSPQALLEELLQIQRCWGELLPLAWCCFTAGCAYLFIFYHFSVT